MKCDKCIHNDVCPQTRINTDACAEFIPANPIEELEHKLEWLLSYITVGKYSKSSYTIEEMQRIKADICPECKERLREHLAKAVDIREDAYYGTNIRWLDDEGGNK